MGVVPSWIFNQNHYFRIAFGLHKYYDSILPGAAYRLAQFLKKRVYTGHVTTVIGISAAICKTHISLCGRGGKTSLSLLPDSTW